MLIGKNVGLADRYAYTHYIIYVIYFRTNSEDIVLEMLTYLETADYSIREEMVW